MSRSLLVAAIFAGGCFEPGPLGPRPGAAPPLGFGDDTPLSERGGRRSREDDPGAIDDGAEPVPGGIDGSPIEDAAGLPPDGAGADPEPSPPCEPLAQKLVCGGSVGFSSADPGLGASVTGTSCTAPLEDRPEHVVRFTAKAAEPVSIAVEASVEGAVSGVAVLGGGGAGCDPSKCLASGAASALLDAEAGETYAIVVEHAVSPPSKITVTAACGDDAVVEPDAPPASEPVCDDEEDEDVDGMTDCADPDCAETLDCAETCSPFSSPKLSCSFEQGFGTGGGQSEATTYACAGAPPAPAKEVVYELALETDELVTVTVSFPGGAVYLLEEEGFGCSPVTCKDWRPGDGSQGPLVFLAEAGRLYYLAIDGPVTGSFGIEVSCD